VVNFYGNEGKTWIATAAKFCAALFSIIGRGWICFV